VGEDGQNPAYSDAAAHLRGEIAWFDRRLPNADRLCDSHIEKRNSLARGEQLASALIGLQSAEDRVEKLLRGHQAASAAAGGRRHQDSGADAPVLVLIAMVASQINAAYAQWRPPSMAYASR
jgi:hypothetical protein